MNKYTSLCVFIFVCVCFRVLACLLLCVNVVRVYLQVWVYQCVSISVPLYEYVCEEVHVRVFVCVLFACVHV